MKTIKVKVNIHCLGLRPGDHVEIDNDPSVQKFLRLGYLTLLVPAELSKTEVKSRGRGRPRKNRILDQ